MTATKAAVKGRPRGDPWNAPGAIGELLGRESLHSSHLMTWLTARERGELSGPTMKKCGPAARVGHEN